MKVLLAGSEVAPLIKLGGLGDVIGALPKALEAIGINEDVIVPYFPIAKVNGKIFKAFEMSVPFDGDSYPVEVFKTKLPDSNVDVFMLKNDKFFGSGGKDAFANSVSETEMFTFFSRAIVEFVKSEFNTYDIVHCNDWHTGLVTHLLQDELGAGRPRTLFTVHNLLYQGKSTADLTREVGIVPGEHSLIDWDIADGDINLMLQGVTSSDFVNAVSPSYAKEILTEEFGRDLADVLKSREGRLTGILNGIDTSVLKREYNVSNWKENKRKGKTSLQEKLGLNVTGECPLFAFISRLDPNQKGLDLLDNVIPQIVENGGQFVLLGTGDKTWQDKLKEHETSQKGNVHIHLAFDAELANEIYAASDFKLVPSRYEPCGLVQMIAMWYGSLPIVHAVGGLKDSVKNGVNGFTFEKYDIQDFSEAVKKALNIYGKKEYDLMVVNAMKTDFSWKNSAEEYAKLYERILTL